MDVELQILKHLPRDAHPTVAIIDTYCAEYRELFKEVRNTSVSTLPLTLMVAINPSKLKAPIRETFSPVLRGIAIEA